MKVDDYIVGIGDADTKWAKHDDVVKFVRQANMTLKLVLVTPVPISEPVAETSSSSTPLMQVRTQAH